MVKPTTPPNDSLIAPSPEELSGFGPAEDNADLEDSGCGPEASKWPPGHSAGIDSDDTASLEVEL